MSLDTGESTMSLDTGESTMSLERKERILQRESDPNSILYKRTAPGSDEFKFQGVPAGFDDYEWEIENVKFQGEKVNIDSLIAYLKLKISFTKEDYKNHSEVHQSYIELVGQQGGCIQGQYYMPLCIATPWIMTKTLKRNMKKLEHIEKTYHDIIPSTYRKFRTDFISITWYKFCRAVREAKKHAVYPTLDVDQLSEETRKIILNSALQVCKI